MEFRLVPVQFRLVPDQFRLVSAKYLGQHQLQQCEITVYTNVTLTLHDHIWTFFFALNGQSLDSHFVIFIHNWIVKSLAMKRRHIQKQYSPSFRYLTWRLTGKIETTLCQIRLFLTSENVFRGKFIILKTLATISRVTVSTLILISPMENDCYNKNETLRDFYILTSELV